ncbi:MAG: DUF1192 domain-containing protein [Pseudomonadota bacterium]
MDDLQPAKPVNTIVLGEDLSTFSIEDIDERVDALRSEIDRLQAEKLRKQDSIQSAQAFFKSK